ncbi:TetR/AcrR family transcriptional regulator [Nocardia asteroides]|uniref:TetR/AcrR family transcriptional regulator n=1 Tax=Nocardia asteroides TaxID=1824 RepID=UPI001E4B7570|nr:TetR/AcrR family transcriptional regulator [Nocardia asteroides]UGT63399.1 TetR/AcrR family transcriptional regulator [Nocardia asteroides]
MGTRERILQAALECFNEDGYDRTSVARIRDRSGVSNGALFHHFPSKEAIAEGLYLEAMRAVQQGYWSVLAGQPATVRESMEGIIGNLLSWVQANPHWARFLYAQGHLDWSTDAGSELQALNAELNAAYRTWLGTFIADGAARDLPMAVAVAVVTGPAHAIARRWLAGQLPGALTDYAPDLIDAATAGLTGTPSPRREPARTPAHAHIRVELLGDDGTVISAGTGTATLTPHRAGGSVPAPPLDPPQ